MEKYILDRVRALHEGDEPIKWAGSQSSWREAWKRCECGEWMLWLLGHLSIEPGSAARRKLVLAACECARLSLPHLPEGEDRPHWAIKMAEGWAQGINGLTLDNVRAAADAAADAADYVAYAAHAAADAAKVAYASDASIAVSPALVVAYVVARDARAASASSRARSAAAISITLSAADNLLYADTRLRTLARCADIVRKHYPHPPRLPRINMPKGAGVTFMDGTDQV